MGAAIQPVGAAGGSDLAQRGVPVAHTALKRVKATPQQVGLSQSERALNVQGAFRVPAEGKAALAGRRLILVDDVLTSGATVEACARALLRAGAANVDVLVFARVVGGGTSSHIKGQATGTDRMAKIEIYTTPYCPYCLSAKALLTRKGVSFTEIDVSGDSEGRRKMIERAGGVHRAADLHRRDRMSAAATSCTMLDREGKLDPLLARGGDAQLAASPETQA